MPCFFVHWSVAMRLAETGAVPEYIHDGYIRYIKLARAHAQRVHEFTTKVIRSSSPKDYEADFKEEHKPVPAAPTGVVKAYLDAIFDSYGKQVKGELYDEMTYFSAYILGACGPDFWMVPTARADLAPIHFDLGHYNRTHAPYRAFLRWVATHSASTSNGQLTRIGKLVSSYFFGMATHFAADLNIHQLVNVSAGAYSLLEAKWAPEHSDLKDTPYIARKFNTHNKVEHFWDSYVRYRFLGDYGEKFKIWNRGGDTDANAATLPVLGCPTAETICKAIEDAKVNSWYWTSNPYAAALANLMSNDYETILKLEVSQNIPRLACDRILKGDFPCFLYDIYLNKTATGASESAYPGPLMFTSAVDEAKPKGQFADNEKAKLHYFATEPNLLAHRNLRKDSDGRWYAPGDFVTASIGTNNFLTYWVLPRLDRLREYGIDVFYDLGDLKGFVASAVRSGRDLLPALQEALDSLLSGQLKTADISTVSLGPLSKFWNLDTGLGLEVFQVPSDTRKEVITKLKFGHVVDLVNRRSIDSVHQTAYTDHMKEETYPDNPPEGEMPKQKIVLAQSFDDLLKATDPGEGKYLDRIRLKAGLRPPVSGGVVASFFRSQTAKVMPQTQALTEAVANGAANEVKLDEVYPRLNLVIETAIADLADGKEELAFYLFGDNLTNLEDAVSSDKAKEHLPHQWLAGQLASRSGAKHNVRKLDFVRVPPSNEEAKSNNLIKASRAPNLRICRFHSQILMNLGKNLTVPKDKKWVNYIDPKSTGDMLGRNFAIATGRKGVLVPDGSGRFWATRDFKCYKKMVSPTEHIFFSLAVIVADCRKSPVIYFEQFSQKPVSESDVNQTIKKIDALNFLKIVLFYKLYSDGVAPLDECYVDGELVRLDVAWARSTLDIGGEPKQVLGDFEGAANKNQGVA